MLIVAFNLSSHISPWASSPERAPPHQLTKLCFSGSFYVIFDIRYVNIK